MRNIPEGAWILRGDRGLTFARDLPPANRIVAGQWWPKDYRGPPLVSIDVDAATALNLKVGDTLTVAILGRPIEARIASLAGDRLAQPRLQLRDHLRARRARGGALHADGDGLARQTAARPPRSSGG